MTWCYPSSGDPLPPSNLSPVPYLASVELSPPLDGLAEEFGYVGDPGLSGQLWLFARRRYGIHYTIGHHLPCQGTDGGVLERPLVPEGNFDRLIAVSGRRIAT